MVSRRSSFSFLAASAMAPFASDAARAAPGDPAMTRDPSFDAFIAAKLEDYGVPGAFVAVVGADGPRFMKGYGIKRRGAPGGVDENTRFQIASVSKFVAAAAIGTLVDAGLVAWDTPARTYAPDLRLAVPYASENATLRDFFAHRTGLPAYAGDLMPELGYDAGELVLRARELPFDHGFREQYAYSNYGIFLGQAAAARAAGLAPPDVLARLLRALGMSRSAPTRSALFDDDNRATAHDTDGSNMPYENVDAFSGAGAIVSTGADFARFVQMLLAGGVLDGKRILAEATIGAMFAPSMVTGPGGPLQDPNAATGLGCDSYRFGSARVIEKNGALNGVRTIVTLIPARRIGILIFANKQLTVFPEAVRAEFLERELGRSGTDLQAQIHAEQAQWLKLVELPARPAQPSPATHPLSAFVGRYDSALYGPLSIRETDGKLEGVIGPTQHPARFIPWAGDTFLLSFDNPDIAPGLLTFTFGGGAATDADGRRVEGAFTTDYGHFARRP